MKKLAIVGKAAEQSLVDSLKKCGFTIWMVGTDPKNDADEYFEFHGLDYQNRVMTREVNPIVREMSGILPLNNSISVMLIEAYARNYKHVFVYGCPMDGSSEMKKQKPALALVIGFLLGLGLGVIWNEAPEKDFYLDKIKNKKNE